MKMTIFTVIGSLVTLSSCSTNSVLNAPVIPTTPDYVVRERNTNTVPEWFSGFNKWKSDNDGKGYIHFIGESGEVNDRISGCELATLMAKKKIAQQIAELVSSNSGSKKQGTLAVDPFDSDDSKLKHAYESMVAEKSIGFLSGAEEKDMFWERRDYTVSKGSPRVYNCSVLVRISEKDYKTALKKSGAKSKEGDSENDFKEMKSIVGDAFKN
jgi:hypothetical protein